MRRSLGLTAVAAIALLGASQALAQQDSSAGNILGRVLNTLLGPQQPAQPEAKPEPQAVATAAPLTPAERMDEVLSDPRRGADRYRDQFRHPAQTLALFDVKPGMTVVDYLPNGWWYTRVLVPYLGKGGAYIGMNPDVSRETGYMKDNYSALGSTLAAEHAKWAGADDAAVSGFNADAVPDGLDGTVDRVLIFREVHNMFLYNWLHHDLAIMRKLLKPGGMIGVVDHRVAETVPFDRSDGSKGYMRESDVIGLFAASGFDLVSKSEINANPKDPTDWKIGVWELPPTYAGANSAKRAKVDAIGESDRMTLLFRKRP